MGSIMVVIAQHSVESYFINCMNVTIYRLHDKPRGLSDRYASFYCAYCCGGPNSTWDNTVIYTNMLF